MKVFISRIIAGNIVKQLENLGVSVHSWDNIRPPTHAELKNACRHMNGLVCMLSDKIDQDFLDACPELITISNYAVGYNNIDTAYAKKKYISVGNTPDVLTEATADLALGLLLSISRQLTPAQNSAKNGNWTGFAPKGFLGINLRNKTVGILGAGRIGQCFATTLSLALNTKTLYYNRSKKLNFEKSISAKRCDLQEILKESDIISIHLPMNRDTKNLLSLKEFSLMKKTALLVNTARGGIIHHQDLALALETNLIQAAALDVTDPEPFPIDHKLFQLENCIITPHIGSATIDTREAMTEICFLNIQAGLKKANLPYPVN